MTAKKHIPKHVGIILDGNRRWAKRNGITSFEGHKRGAEVFKEVSVAAFEQGIKYLSAYVFSAENWQRTEDEVSYLMNLIVKGVEKYLDEFNNKGIKIVILGCRDKLNAAVLKSIGRTEQKTKNNKNGTLAICLNYGGHQEIVDAVNKFFTNNPDKNTISVEDLEQNLYSPYIPPVDLLIRTSNEQRISGFMLWRIAYAEFVFSEKLWPDFSEDDLIKALQEYKNRQRRFGV